MPTPSNYYVNSAECEYKEPTSSSLGLLWFYAVTFQETPGNFREFKLYTDVTSRKLQYAFQQSSAREEDTYNFPAVGMGFSCSWKRLFAIGSTTEVK